MNVDGKRRHAFRTILSTKKELRAGQPFVICRIYPLQDVISLITLFSRSSFTMDMSRSFQATGYGKCFIATLNFKVYCISLFLLSSLFPCHVSLFPLMAITVSP